MSNKTEPQKKVVELRDLKLLLALGSMLPSAWVLPTPAWPMVAKMITLYKNIVPWEEVSPLSRPAQEILVEHFKNLQIIEFKNNLDLHRHLLRLQILRLLSPWGWKPTVRIEGSAILDEALQSKKGAILWMSHFIYGGIVGKIALSDAGYRVAHLSRPEHGFSKTAFGIRVLNPIRCFAEDRYLKRRVKIDPANMIKVMKTLKNLLSENYLVSITAGAWEGRQFVESRVFDHGMKLATGAPALSYSTGAPLIPVFVCATNVPNHYTLIIEEPLELDKNDTKREAVNELTTKFLQLTQRYVLKSPDQWRAWSKVIPVDSDE